MFAEQLVIDLPFETAAIPPWGWWAAGLAAWYVPAGLVVRRMRLADERKGEPEPTQAYAVLWAFSPLVCVLVVFAALVVVGCLAVWTVGAVASCGAIPFPWSKSVRTAAEKE